MIPLQKRELIIEWDRKGKTQQEISELLNCHQSSVSRFLRKYTRRGVIENLPRSGRPTKLTKKNLILLKENILARIKAMNNEYCSVSTKQVANIIRQEIGETYSLRHVERIMHMLDFSLITPRPQHIKHDQEKVDTFRDEFKKKFNRSMWVTN